MASERIEVQRTIEVEPAAIFRVLCDPQGHVAIDSSGMLMDADGDPVRAPGGTPTGRPSIPRGRPASSP
jgi:hypothetical protein